MKTFLQHIIDIWPLLIAGILLGLYSIIKRRIKTSHEMVEWKDGFFVGFVGGVGVGMALLGVIWILVQLLVY